MDLDGGNTLKYLIMVKDEEEEKHIEHRPRWGEYTEISNYVKRRRKKKNI